MRYNVHKKCKFILLPFLLAAMIICGVPGFFEYGGFMTLTAQAAETAFTKPETLEELNAADPAELAKLSSFDSRDYGIVTKVQAQGATNLCWAYASMGAAEIAVLKAGLTTYEDINDWNPLNPCNFAYQAINYCSDDLGNFTYTGTVDSTYDVGGSTASKGNLFAQWRAPAYAHYSYYEGHLELGRENVKYKLKSFVEVASPSDGGSIEDVKKAVAKYGAVSFGYYPTDDVYAYGSNSVSGHASVIVGWDDTIDASLFTPNTPSQNGGWIVKNSWGKDAHDGTGYFYLSYDTDIWSVTAYEFVSDDTWDNNYYYDGGRDLDSTAFTLPSASDYCMGGVVFEVKKSSATQKEILKSVNVALGGKINGVVDGDVTVSVYTDVDPSKNDPTAGDFRCTTGKVRCHYSGYYTIDLDEEIELEGDTYFGIVVKVDYNDGISAPIRMDKYLTNTAARVYYSTSNGESWVSSTEGYLPRIKAYTKNVERTESVENNLSYSSVALSENTYEYCGEYCAPIPTVTYNGATLRLDTDYTVSYADNFYPGLATVTVTGIGEYSGSKTVYFTINTGKIPPDCPGTARFEQALASRNWTLTGSYTTYGEIPLPDNYAWLDVYKDRVITEGADLQEASFQYIGDDAQYYRQTMYDLYMTYTKIDSSEVKTITSDDVSLSETLFTYTGLPIKAGVTVTCEGKTLTQGEDYFVYYSNNTGVGTATATVLGLGLYSGTVDKTYAITAVGGIQEAPPAITIDYVNEKLTGFAADGSYAIDGAAVTPSNGELEVDGYMGKTISIVKKGNSTTTTDSEPQLLAIPARPAAPSVFAVSETVMGNEDGKITHVSTDMEYKLSADNQWIACTGTELTGLAAGTYEVRIKATAGSFASDVISVIVGEGEKRPHTPEVTAPQANILTYNGSAQQLVTAGTTSGGVMQYSLDGVTYTTAVPTATEAGNYTVYYQVIGGDNFNDVSAEHITVTIEKAASPALPNQEVYFLYNIGGTGKVDLTEAVSSYAPVTNYSVGTVTDAIVSSISETDGVLTFDVSSGHVDETAIIPVTVSFRNYEDAILNVTVTLIGQMTVADRFIDVPKGSWYEEAVQFVYDKGLMEGNGNLFTPNGQMTRGMFVTTLYRLAGEPELTEDDRAALKELHDVGEGAWYTDAVCWAYANGITTGYENDRTFRTNVALSREQLATFLYRYAQYQELDTSATDDLEGLLNTDKVKPYAAKEVKWAVGAEIINGMEITDEAGNTVYDLAPQKTATRAQMAQILMRFCEAYRI